MALRQTQVHWPCSAPMSPTSGRSSRHRQSIATGERIHWTAGQSAWLANLRRHLAAPVSFLMTGHPTRPSCFGQSAAARAGRHRWGSSSMIRRVFSSAFARPSHCVRGLNFRYPLPAPPATAAPGHLARPPARSEPWPRDRPTMCPPAWRISGRPTEQRVARAAWCAGPVRSRKGSGGCQNNPLSTCGHFWESDPTSNERPRPRETIDPHATCEIGLVGERR